jgi:uncharacterized membrane protein YgaE (UPF0421/DUF939 family)
MSAGHIWARLADVLGRYPRVPLALKSAFAAGLAWLAVLPLGGVADEYPYYAPLGAVVAMGATVVTSVRASVQGVLALILGAGLSIGVGVLPLPEVAAIASVVFLGTVAAGWRHIGEMASWVPISALFILIIGRTDPEGYALAYVGLTALGAAIGVLVNTALPPLPLNATGVTQSTLLETLAQQLEDLAEGLLQDPLLTSEQWEQRQRAIEPQTREMRQMVTEATEARRVNWRARRWRQTADRQYTWAQALQRLSFLVEDITGLVVEQEHAGRQEVVLGPTLRPPTARALRAMSRALRSMHGATTEPDALRGADGALQELTVAIRDARVHTEDDLFAAGTIVTAIQRAVAALVENDLASSGGQGTLQQDSVGGDPHASAAEPLDRSPEDPGGDP